MKLIGWSFGPRFQERTLRRMNNSGDPAFAPHASCWVNEWDCGAPGCVMGAHSGAPEAIDREAKETNSPVRGAEQRGKHGRESKA